MDTLHNIYTSLREHPIINGLLPHLLTVAGFLLALLTIARLISERKQPSNTFAWLLAIAFVPYIGVPLYLLLGGRKIQRLAARKAREFARADAIRAELLGRGIILEDSAGGTTWRRSN